jgi:hypothetical protein
MTDFMIYIWDVIHYGWVILLILGVIFIPIMFIMLSDIREYESLYNYYKSLEDEDKENL